MIITPTVLADNTAIHAVRSAVGMILSSSVRLSVTKCIVAKRYILQQKCLNKWIVNVPGTRFYNFQPLYGTYPLKLHNPTFRNFTYLLYLAFLITRPFCLCCYERLKILLSRWLLINASYWVRSAISATAGLLVSPRAEMLTSINMSNTVLPNTTLSQQQTFQTQSKLNAGNYIAE